MAPASGACGEYGRVAARLARGDRVEGRLRDAVALRRGDGLVLGLLGALATYLIFDGFTASTLGGNFTQVVFAFKLSPALIGSFVLLGIVCALAALCSDFTAHGGIPVRRRLSPGLPDLGQSNRTVRAVQG